MAEMYHKITSIYIYIYPRHHVCREQSHGKEGRTQEMESGLPAHAHIEHKELSGNRVQEQKVFSSVPVPYHLHMPPPPSQGVYLEDSC